MAQPPNDDLADAIQVFGLPYSHGISDVESNNSTIETSENPNCGLLPGESWWYTFTVITAGDFNISAICSGCTSGGDVEIGIYQGSSFPLTVIYCQDDDNENSLGESTTQTLAVGTYYLRVAGNNSQTPDNPPITTTISSAGGVDAVGGGTASIPTLSEWGLLILALLLMTFGTLYLLQPSVRSGIFEQER